MAKLTHGSDTSHPCATLERMQMSLQLGDGFLVLGSGLPAGKSIVNSFQQFAGLLAEDGCNLCIKFDFVLASRGLFVSQIMLCLLSLQASTLCFKFLQQGINFFYQGSVAISRQWTAIKVFNNVLNCLQDLATNAKCLIAQAFACVKQFSDIPVPGLGNRHTRLDIRHIGAA